MTSLNPRLRLGDGLYDKGNWVQDAHTSQTSLNLFKKWFAERKLFAPHANIWNFDLGKLVVPSVFMDYDLLEAVAKNYDQATRVVRRIDGEILITISPEEINWKHCWLGGFIEAKENSKVNSLLFVSIIMK